MADRSKFQTDGQDDFDKLFESYSELEKRLGSITSKVPSKVSLDTLGPYLSEAAQNEGKISESSYSELESKFGLSRELIDAFSSGEAAKSQVFYNSLKEQVGGPDAFDSLMAWAKESLTVDEKKVLAGQLDSGDPETANMAIKSLQARQQVSSKVPAGNQLAGTPAATPNTKAFGSTKEVAKAMGDEKYGVDTEYTQQINERLMATGGDLLDAKSLNSSNG